MKTFIFIPDTDNKAGFGHFHRCMKYSNFVKKRNKIIFLINKNYNKKNLIKKNFYGVNIKYVFFKNLLNTLSFLNLKRGNIITILDTYNSRIHSINFKKFSDTHVNILDFKLKCKSDYIIDHTFKRNKKFHSNNSILKVGVEYFPIIKTSSLKKKNIILINFGSVKSKKLIKKSLMFIKKIKIGETYKIIILDKFFLKKDIPKINIKNKIFVYKYVTNIEEIYAKTLFSIGACGISLYEKCYFHIPCISKCVASNQVINFRNFYSKACILNFDKVTNLKVNINKHNSKNFLNQIFQVKKNLKKNFIFSKNKSNLTKMFEKLNEN